MPGYTSRVSQYIDKYMTIDNTANGKKTSKHIKIPFFSKRENLKHLCLVGISLLHTLFLVWIGGAKSKLRS